MKYQINRNSWHYRLINAVLSNADRRYDFCSYWRGLLLALLLVALMLIFLVFPFFIYPLWVLFYEVVYTGNMENLHYLFMSLFVWAFSGLIVLKLWWKNHQRPDQPPGLIRMKYDSLKNRFCPRVEFVDE